MTTPAAMSAALVNAVAPEAAAGLRALGATSTRRGAPRLPRRDGRATPGVLGVRGDARLAAHHRRHARVEEMARPRVRLARRRAGLHRGRRAPARRRRGADRHRRRRARGRLRAPGDAVRVRGRSLAGGDAALRRRAPRAGRVDRGSACRRASWSPGARSTASGCRIASGRGPRRPNASPLSWRAREARHLERELDPAAPAAAARDARPARARRGLPAGDEGRGRGVPDDGDRGGRVRGRDARAARVQRGRDPLEGRPAGRRAGVRGRSGPRTIARALGDRRRRARDLRLRRERQGGRRSRVRDEAHVARRPPRLGRPHRTSRAGRS